MSLNPGCLDLPEKLLKSAHAQVPEGLRTSGMCFMIYINSLQFPDRLFPFRILKLFVLLLRKEKKKTHFHPT